MTNPGSGVAQLGERGSHKPEVAGSTPAPAPSPRIVYFTEAEAAEYLRLARGTLQHMRVSGKGPRFRDHGANGKGGRITYKIADLDAWSDGRAKLSTSDVEAANSTT